MGIIKVFLREGASVDAGVAQITAIAQTIIRQAAGADASLVIRYNASTVPILQYALSSATLSEQELYDLAQNQSGSGSPTVSGAQVPWPYSGKSRLVSVDLDLAALKAKNLTAQDVVTAFSAQSLVLPSGTAKIGATEYDVEVNSQPRVLDELNDLPIRQVNGADPAARCGAGAGWLPAPGERGASDPDSAAHCWPFSRAARPPPSMSWPGSSPPCPASSRACRPRLRFGSSPTSRCLSVLQSNDVIKEGLIAAALTAHDSALSRILAQHDSSSPCPYHSPCCPPWPSSARWARRSIS